MSDSEGEEQEQLTEEQIVKDIEEKCYKAFMDFDEEGSGALIKSDQVQNVLEQMQIKISEQEIFKIIAEIDPENTGEISYAPFKQRICEREVERLLGNDETELLDAYVAMGGESDGGGCVDATKLIYTIKQEFGMTIDIEKLIDEIDEDGSGEIEFDEFKALLANEA